MTEQDLDKKLDNALNAEPSFRLPSNFASKVVKMVEAKQMKTEVSRDGWWLAAGIVAILGAFVYAMIAVGFKPSLDSFGFLSGHAGLVIFGALFIVVLNIIDRFLRKRTEV